MERVEAGDSIGSFRLRPFKLEWAGRIDDTHPSAEAASLGAEARELGIGADYYCSGHDHKLQADPRDLDDGTRCLCPSCIEEHRVDRDRIRSFRK